MKWLEHNAKHSFSILINPGIIGENIWKIKIYLQENFDKSGEDCSYLK